MKKILVIEDRAKFIYFRNRKIRTPVTLNVTDAELKHLKVAMKMADVQNWKVEIPTNKKDEVIDYDYEEPTDCVIEELEDEEEPKTILEGFMRKGDEE